MKTVKTVGTVVVVSAVLIAGAIVVVKEAPRICEAMRKSVREAANGPMHIQEYKRYQEEEKKYREGQSDQSRMGA